MTKIHSPPLKPSKMIAKVEEKLNLDKLDFDIRKPNPIPPLKDVRKLGEILARTEFSYADTPSGKSMEYFEDLGFKDDKKLNEDLNDLKFSIDFFYTSYSKQQYFKDPKFKSMLETLAATHSHNFSDETLKDKFLSGLGIKEQMTDLIYDYLYYRDRRNSEDSFIAKYLNAKAKGEAAHKEKRKNETWRGDPFPWILEQMRRDNMAKNPNKVSPQDFISVYRKNTKLLDAYSKPVNPEDLRNVKRTEYNSYLVLCEKMYKARVIDIKTFEDMTCKILERKPELDKYLVSQPAYQEMRKNLADTYYVEKAYEEIMAMKPAELVLYHIVKNLKRIPVMMGLLDKKALGYKLKEAG